MSVLQNEAAGIKGTLSTSDPDRASATPASAAASARVETGFSDLDGTSTLNEVFEAAGPNASDAELDARVAALLPTKSTTDWNAVSAFMAIVVPWPKSAADPGYVNLHFSSVNSRPGGKDKFVGGWPFQSVDQFVRRAAWIESTTQFKDVWFCTSLQTQMGTNTKGKPKAKRCAQNALALKAIWIDLDVGPEAKKYPTVEEALKEVLVFQEQVGLPMPSAVVLSESGLHVYWISEMALPPAIWAQFARGLRAKIAEAALKCDAGLTTDSARLLRVPGTLNHKTNPPKRVALLDVPLITYNFETELCSLKNAMPPRAAPAGERSVFAEGVSETDFTKPAPAFDGLSPDEGLQAGIDKHSERLLDGRPIFKQCGFLREALRTGGRDYDNPLWNLSVLCTTFIEKGNDVAHAISENHKDYTHDETQAHYDRKMAERKERRIGWPSCAAIQSNGSAACAACPLLGKIKSPLQLGMTGAASNEPPGAQQSPNSDKETANGHDEWPDGCNKFGTPMKGYANTLGAFPKLGIKFTLDTFRQKEFSEGHEIEMLNGELSDRAVTMLRDQIRRECGFYPDKETVREAITAECLRNRINPVVAYFDGLTWDGTPRLSKLLHNYLASEDTPLNEAISVKLMCAIVRRSKRPGCKYDHEVVLQSGQGVRKSMFCEDCAVFPDLFTDAGDLSADPKQQMEVGQGKQIIEFP
jgi:Virulence-associated protein E